jgi:hypothetical protein
MKQSGKAVSGLHTPSSSHPLINDMATDQLSCRPHYPRRGKRAIAIITSMARMRLLEASGNASGRAWFNRK